MQNVYEICFYGGLVLAVLLLIASIVLFIVLKIPKVIGDLTGSTARKTMKAMENGELVPGSLSKKEQEKYYNLGTGKITVKKAVSSKEERKKLGNDSTELLDKPADPEFQETDILRPGVNDYEAATEQQKPEPETEAKPQSELQSETNDEPEKEKVENAVNIANDVSDIVEEKTEDVQAGDDNETAVLTENEVDTITVMETQVGDDSETAVLTGNETITVMGAQVGDDNETAVLAGNETITAMGAQVGDDNETAVLTGNETTTAMGTQAGDDNETAVLTGDEAQTDVLRADEEEETDVLSREDDAEDTNELALSSGILAKKVKVLYNVLVVHTEESLQAHK